MGALIGETANILAVDSGTESREAVVAVIDLVSEDVPDSPEAIMSCIAKASDALIEYDVRPERAGELRLRVGFGLSGIHGDEGEQAVAPRIPVGFLPEVGHRATLADGIQDSAPPLIHSSMVSISVAVR